MSVLCQGSRGGFFTPKTPQIRLIQPPGKLTGKDVLDKLCRKFPSINVSLQLWSLRDRRFRFPGQSSLQGRLIKGCKLTTEHRTQVSIRTTKDGDAPATAKDAGAGSTDCTLVKSKLYSIKTSKLYRKDPHS